MIEVVRQGYFTGILYHDVKMAEIGGPFAIKIDKYPDEMQIFMYNYEAFTTNFKFGQTTTFFKWNE